MLIKMANFLNKVIVFKHKMKLILFYCRGYSSKLVIRS